MQTKKMFKVIAPIDKRGGGTWWMRCGSAYVNKDESINIYVDALPLGGMSKGEGVRLQLREVTEEELRERAEKQSSYASRGPVDPNGLPSMLGESRGGGSGGGFGGGGSGGARGGYGDSASGSGGGADLEPPPF